MEIATHCCCLLSAMIFELYHQMGEHECYANLLPITETGTQVYDMNFQFQFCFFININITESLLYIPF